MKGKGVNLKNVSLYAHANELNLDKSKSGEIRIPFGTWDFGTKKLDDGRTVFFTQTLAAHGAEKIAQAIATSVADGEKGVPVYWGHPDVPELAHKYPDKRAKGWIKSAKVEGDALVLSVEWLEENATDGFGWFSPYWTGPATNLGQGRYLKTIDSIVSIALINIPNIQEFRLANEAGELLTQRRGVAENAAFLMPAHLAALAKRFDERRALPNSVDANGMGHSDENGQFDGSGNGGAGGGGGTSKKSQGSGASLEKRFRSAVKEGLKHPDAVRFNDALVAARKKKDGAGIARAHMLALKSGLVWDKRSKGYYKPVGFLANL